MTALKNFHVLSVGLWIDGVDGVCSLPAVTDGLPAVKPAQRCLGRCESFGIVEGAVVVSGNP